MVKACFSAICAALVIAASTLAQDAGVVVYGQISAGDSPLSSWKVQLARLRDGETWDTEISWNGGFELHGVPLGDHRLRVLDGRGGVLHDEVVSVRRDGETLSIRFRTEDLRPHGRGETIAVQQLTHKSPRKALNDLKNGREALEKQQYTRAVGYLESAVAVDPDSADAHNDLGVAYFQLEQYQKSLEHFKTATDLAPTHERANNNLCLSLLKTGRYREAAQAANGVLRRGGSAPIVHYAAAVGLLAEGGNLSEVLDHLRRVGGRIPKARLLTARVLADAGRRAEAAGELEAYLRSPEADTDSRRPELEALLSELKR